MWKKSEEVGGLRPEMPPLGAYQEYQTEEAEKAQPMK